MPPGFMANAGAAWPRKPASPQKVEIQMGTLGKALGASGGYICGSRALIDCLINRARSFVFSTAPVPAAAAAAAAGVRFVQSEAGEERCRRLWANVAAVAAHRALARKGTPLAERRGKTAAIIPIMIGDEDRAMDMARRLREQGVFIPAIRYPTVARGQARLRLTLSAAHTPADVAQMLAALDSALNPKPSCLKPPKPPSPSWTTATSGIPSPKCATGSGGAPIVIVDGRGAVLRDAAGPRVSGRQLLHLDQPPRPRPSQNQRRPAPPAQKNRPLLRPGPGQRTGLAASRKS